MFQKKGVGTRRLQHSKNHGSLAGTISHGFAARDGSNITSHSTILQWLRRQISLHYYTIPPAMQATSACIFCFPDVGHVIMLKKTVFFFQTFS